MATKTKTGGLGVFEGSKVSATGVDLRGVSGGLDDGLKIDPAIYHVGDEITISVRCRIKGIRHDEIKDSDDVKRVHIATVSEGMVIDDDLVAEAFELQQERIEKAAGIHKIPGMETADPKEAEPAK